MAGRMGSAPQSSPFPSSGTKRKRMETTSVYGVRVGATPGVYHSWPECYKQIDGFKNAIFKKFSTVADAEAFVHNSPSRQTPATGAPQKFYAVRSGRKPGIYTDWSSALAQITGWQKPVHKSFSTRREAEEFLNGNAASNQNGATPAPSKGKKVRKSDTAIAEPDGTVPPGIGSLPAGSIDGFDSRLAMNEATGNVEYKSEEQRKATKMMPVGAADGAPLRIYTDGSALNNGAYGAVAGIGIFFGHNDPRNLGEALSGNRQTNQRAELSAIQRAMDIAPIDKDITIITDSQYAINCATIWFIAWRKNGWQTSDKKPVENRDLVEPIISKIDERHRFRAKTKFEWIKGHGGDEGNEAADRLAVRGAQSQLMAAT